MKVVFAGWLVLALTMVLSVSDSRTAAAHAGSEQVCAGGAQPVTTVEIDGATTIDRFVPGFGPLRFSFVTGRTTTENYNGVRGLIRTVTVDEFGTTISWGFPAWLLAAYDNNTAAILADIDRGALKDRGPCI